MTDAKITAGEREQMEALAEYAHKAWAGWMEYLFTKCEEHPDGTAVIPKWAVDRWVRQKGTAYSELPETEKESDRDEARRILEIIAHHRAEQSAKLEAAKGVIEKAKGAFKRVMPFLDEDLDGLITWHYEEAITDTKDALAAITAWEDGE